MAYTPSLEEIITLAGDERMRSLFVALPGKVVSRDLSDNTVDVEIQVRIPVLTDDDETAHEELPILPAVPVMFQMSGPFSITFPIAAGDTGLVLAMSYSISQWLDSGAVSNPGDTRISHISNAVFLPGLCPKADIPAAASVNALVLEAAEVRVGAGASHLVALENLVANELTKIQAAFSSAAVPGAGAVVYLSPYSPGPVACTKLKAE